MMTTAMAFAPGKGWRAVPLTDGLTAGIGLYPRREGRCKRYQRRPLKCLDCGQSFLVVRWFIYAVVGKGEADIVPLSNLQRSAKAIREEKIWDGGAEQRQAA
jgi:hypothetical protein